VSVSLSVQHSMPSPHNATPYGPHSGSTASPQPPTLLGHDVCVCGCLCRWAGGPPDWDHAAAKEVTASFNVIGFPK
jgi:hypothetical protein